MSDAPDEMDLKRDEIFGWARALFGLAHDDWILKVKIEIESRDMTVSVSYCENLPHGPVLKKRAAWNGDKLKAIEPIEYW